MPRPLKCRQIGFSPDYTFYKPAGVPGKSLEEVKLSVDELEAVRLADLEGLYQEDAAKEMDISRQTLGNIISSAHQKIADAIVNGKIIKIAGGKVEMKSEREFLCEDCSHSWTLPFGTGRPEKCPECESENIHRTDAGRGQRGRMRQKCRHHKNESK
jgi:predicted DNA-binding protein (UPF0251 family)